MIREAKREDIPICVDLIKKSFMTVANELGFTEENAPGFTAFALRAIDYIGKWSMRIDECMFLKKMGHCVDTIRCLCRQ